MTGSLRKNRLYTELTKIWPLIPAAVYLLGFLVIVAIYLAVLSFSVIDGQQTRFSTATFMRVVSMPQFGEALVNTSAFVIIGTPLELALGLYLALLLYRPFVLRGIIRSILMIPLAVPALVTATLLFILFDFPCGHINHLLTGSYCWFPEITDIPVNWRSSRIFALSIALVGKVWRDMPISMLILLSGINSIDPELFDAARSMGAGFFKRLRYIIIPLILPSISAVLLLRSIEMWKEFIFPFVLAGRYNLLGTLIESFYNDWGLAGESAVVALVLVICTVLSAIVLTSVMEFLKRRPGRMHSGI
jgi:ABC-type sugar transport system permease subunit